MRQGEVWTPPGQRFRVVVISSDEFNTLPGFRPIIVPLVRLPAEEQQGLAARTTEADHISGFILVQFPQHITPLTNTLETTLSGRTMGRVVDAIQQLYSY